MTVMSQLKTQNMKSFTLLVFLSFWAVALRAQNLWNLGFRFSPSANFSTFEGDGMASGRFELVPLGTAIMGLMAQYQFSEHWSGEAGLNWAGMGFSTEFRKDYALSGGKPDKIQTRHEFVVLHLPLAVVWRSRLNCRNWRTYLKAGVLMQARGAERHKKHEESAVLSATTTADISISAQAQPFVTGGFILGFGREKQFKSGSRFSWGASLILNGARTLRGQVSYTDGNQSYTHSLINKGHYFSIDFAYFLKPFSTEPADGY